MNTTVRLFAIYRDQAGVNTIEMPMAQGSKVSDLLIALERRLPQLRLHHRPTLVAVNTEYASPDQTLNDGDEVAIIPPVSGGAHVHIRITTNSLDTQAITDMVRLDTNGAVVVFEGVTRRCSSDKEVLHLEYEAFVTLAEKELASIAKEIRQKWGVQNVAVEHRIGRVEIGQASLVVAVGSAHRMEAFQAIIEIMDRIKSTVPIWKKEFFTDGAVWVQSESDRVR